MKAIAYNSIDICNRDKGWHGKCGYLYKVTKISFSRLLFQTFNFSLIMLCSPVQSLRHLSAQR